MVTIGVMQPYVFPYLPYFQLINAVQKFVIYDDVTFIKQGWINRNNILINGKPYLFTIPLEKASSFNIIRQTKLSPKLYPIWVDKFVQTIEQNYKKAPFYEKTASIIKKVLSNDYEFISELAYESLTSIAQYLKIDTEFIQSSTIYQNSELKSQARIIDICKKEKADHYINLIGGQELYSKNEFQEQGLTLSFIKSNTISYSQFKQNEFVSWLSIIDVLMFTDPDTIKKMLNNYELI